MVRLARTRRDAFIGGVVVATAVAAAFASGGRTALLFAIALTVFGLGISRATPQGPRGRLPIVASLGAVVLTVVVLGGVFSSVTSTRIDFYTRTLNPVSTGSEVVPRIRYYTANAIYGVQKGGITGRGTGTESVGKQYLGEDAPDSVTESGWGSVAAEWGFFGLLLWIAWTVAWIGRTFAAVRRGRETAAGPITPVIAFFVVLTLVVLHSVGSQGFDNYITNVYFWLLSGVAFAALIANEPPIAGAVDRSPELQSIV
jgi:cell division protein FtsW (lipid II flippase)